MRWLRKPAMRRTLIVFLVLVSLILLAGVGYERL